jgi:aminoglycoside phosphotransferase (APT) family kinase protein
MIADVALNEAEAVAREVLRTQFAIRDTKVAHQETGRTNYVFEVPTAPTPLVLRMGPKATKQQAFAREHCVIDRLREAGIPVPDVLGQGESGDWAYMAVRRIAGEQATDHPRRADIMRDVGRLAAVQIHRIETIGFGRDFALEGKCGGGGRSWRDWLNKDLDAAARLELLRAHRVIADAQWRELRQTLEAIEQWTGPPVLNHGDLRLKNVLVDSEGQIVGLIDWEWCVSSVGGHWDLSVALHDLNIDQKEAFIDGYGLTPEAVREQVHVWRLFNALNYAPVVGRRLEANDQAAVERLRTRFSGALDLYWSG